MVNALVVGAVVWGFSAAGWLLSPIITTFVNKCFDALGVNPPLDLLKKLDNLQTTLLPRLLILTDAAQKSPYRDVLKQWLQKLKFAIYEAEHVLGLVEYQRLENKVNSIFPSDSNSNINDESQSMFPFSLFENDPEKDLMGSLENLEKIVNEAMDKFGNLLNQSNSSINNSTMRPTTPYKQTISTPDSTIIGRDEDLKHIVKLLREETSSNSKCYSVIGIWGMGGMGKTTLAQYVCEKEKNLSADKRYFDLVIWAHVSQEFSVQSIWERI